MENMFLVASDLHLEGYVNKSLSLKGIIQESPAKILILAGDVCEFATLTSGHIDEFLFDISSRFNDVIWVPGNHEYYTSSINSENDAIGYLNFIGIKNIHILQKAIFSIPEISTTFVCATLWTDFNRSDTHLMLGATWYMMDYNYIAKNDRSLSPNDVMEIHTAHREFIFESVKNIRESNQDERIVVVSHHAPSHLSVDVCYANSKANGYYYSDLSKELHEDAVPDFWIHGHMHSYAEYTLNKTKVICNPHGYLGREISVGDYSATEVW